MIQVFVTRMSNTSIAKKLLNNVAVVFFIITDFPNGRATLPKKFFKAADKYKGNRRYMEIEFALLNELTTVEQKLRSATLVISSNILHERKKTTPSLPLRKNLNTAHLMTFLTKTAFPAPTPKILSTLKFAIQLKFSLPLPK